MKKITCNVLLLFTIICPFIASGQLKADLENNDSLIHYLQMKQHPDYPEASAYYIYKIINQDIGANTTELTLDIAFKIFKVKDVEEYTNLILPRSFRGFRLANLKVTTYNFENGLVQTKELNKKALQNAEIGSNQSVKMLSAVNIKDGSILRYQLTIKNVNHNETFNFQEDFPVKYAAFELTALTKRKINVTTSVKIPFEAFKDINAFNQSTLPAISLAAVQNRNTIYKWIRKDLAPFKKEIFASNQSPENIKFKFAVDDIETLRRIRESAFEEMNWDQFNRLVYDTILVNSFAKNDFLYQQLPPITGEAKDSLEIAKKLFKYIQDSFTTVRYLASDFKEVIKKKEATSTNLNQLLCALYRHAGLASDLIYVSIERDNPLSPDKARKTGTEIAVRVVINGISYLCNPSIKNLPFGYLPYRYYNGYTRLINKSGGFIYLDPSQAKNMAKTEVNIVPVDTAKNRFKLIFKKDFGIYYSINERQDYKKDSVTYENFYKKIVERLIPDLEINKYVITVNNLNNIEQAFSLIAEADIQMGDNTDMLFLDPFLQKIYNGVNPFLEVKDRSTDVEMDFCYHNSYTFSFKLNDAFSIAELPSKSSLQYSSPATIKYQQSANYNASTNTVEVKYNYDVMPIVYTPEEVKDLNSFYTELMRVANQKLLLNKK